MEKTDYIKTLDLSPHAEGGWYRQVYHSDKTNYDVKAEDQRYEYTSIYFLLDGGSPSHLHRLLHDELWYFHAGSAIVIHCFYPDGTYQAIQLGPGITKGQQMQFKVPAGTIFGSEVLDPDSFGLVSCVVAPGFDYHDFELFTQAQLLPKYPEQAAVIRRVAYEKVPTE